MDSSTSTSRFPFWVHDDYLGYPPDSTETEDAWRLRLTGKCEYCTQRTQLWFVRRFGKRNDPAGPLRKICDHCLQERITDFPEAPDAWTGQESTTEAAERRNAENKAGKYQHV
jgi:hypothetical protein